MTINDTLIIILLNYQFEINYFFFFILSKCITKTVGFQTIMLQYSSLYMFIIYFDSLGT